VKKARFAVGNIAEFKRRGILKIEKITKRYNCSGTCKVKEREGIACSKCDGFMYTGILLAGQESRQESRYDNGRGNFAGCYCRKLSKEEAVFYLL